MQKKTISLIVSFMILCTCLLPVNIYVSAEDLNLIFELDLSEASAENPVIKDSVSGAQGAILPKSGQEGMKLPDVVEEQTSGIKYLSYSKYGSSKEAESLYFTNEAFMNQKEMSFELWIKPNGFVDGSGSYRMFDLAFNTQHQEQDTVDVFCYKGAFRWRPNSGNSGTTALDYKYDENTAAKATIQSTNGKWTHVVFTRKWVPTAEGSSTGVWEGDTYINGTPLSRTATGQAVEYHTKSDKYLCIGNNTKGTAPFYGDIAEFKVYNIVLSENTVVDNYKNGRFTYLEYSDTLEVEEISREEGTMPYTAGEIRITFNNYVDVDTIADGITFTKSNGDPVRGGVTVEADSDITKEVIINYGTLELGEDYQINITSDLKSLNNRAFSGSGVYTYTATKEYIFYEDFKGDEYVVGEQPPVDGSFRYTSSETDDDVSNIIVKENDDFRYISMTGGGQTAKNSRVTLVFDNPITERSFAMDLKIRPASTDSVSNSDTPRDVMTIRSTSGKSMRFASMRNGSVKTDYISAAHWSCSNTFSFSKTDGRGFYDIHATFIKDDNGNYVVTIQNANDLEEGKSVYTMTGDNVFAGIKQMELSHLYPLTAEQAVNASSDIALLAIYPIVVPEILSVNLGELSREDDTLEILFSDDIDEDTLGSSTFTLVAPDGKNVYTEYDGYDSDRRIATIKLKDYLKPSTQYTLKTREITAESGITIAACERKCTTKAATVEATDVRLYDENDIEIDTLDGAKKFKASVTFSNSGLGDVEYTVALVLYSSDGRIVEMISASEDKETTVSAVAENLTDISKIKVLAWFEKDRGSISLLTPVSIEKR